MSPTRRAFSSLEQVYQRPVRMYAVSTVSSSSADEVASEIRQELTRKQSMGKQSESSNSSRNGENEQADHDKPEVCGLRNHPLRDSNPRLYSNRQFASKNLLGIALLKFELLTCVQKQCTKSNHLSNSTTASEVTTC